MIDRLTPVAFGGLFALSGAIGPILAQNWGAARFDRMGDTLRSCVTATLVYAATVWLLLILLRWPLAGLFGLKDEAAELFAFFCLVGGAIWFFNGLLFLGNAAFNNLGFPLRSSLLNWAGRRSAPCLRPISAAPCSARAGSWRAWASARWSSACWGCSWPAGR